MWSVCDPRCLLLVVLAASATLGIQDARFLEYTDKQILDYLTNRSRYDKRMRPTDLTFVNVTVILLSLSSPDESSLKYEVEFLMNLKWFDPRLRYDDGGRHRYLNGLKHVDYVWLPDTYFIKHGEFKYPLIPVEIALKVQPDGAVQFTMRRSMILNCQGNLHIFPFDNLKCPFAIESVSHEQYELELQWSITEPSISGASSLRRHNAYLVKNTTGPCDDQHTWRGNYSCLLVLLVFTRDKSFYISTVFVPGIVLVTSSFISFWLDINAVPARVMIGVTTMLNFCTTTNSFRSTLPVVSNLTAMNLWDGVCMFFIYASMLEFILVNYLFRKLHHRPSMAVSMPPPPPPPSAPSEPLRRSQSALSQAELRPLYEKPDVSEARDEGEQYYDRPGNGCKSTGEVQDGSTTPAGTQDFVDNNHMNHRLQSDKARAAASVFAWLRRPQVVNPPAETHSRSRIAKYIDNVSKLVFPLLFGTFTLVFLMVFAVIKPSQDENWNLSGFVAAA